MYEATTNLSKNISDFTEIKNFLIGPRMVLDDMNGRHIVGITWILR